MSEVSGTTSVRLIVGERSEIGDISMVGLSKALQKMRCERSAELGESDVES